MTNKEIDMLAEKIAEKLWDRQQEEMVDIKKASEITGLAVKTLYKRKDAIGYLKRGKGLYFKRKCLEIYNQIRQK